MTIIDPASPRGQAIIREAETMTPTTQGDPPPLEVVHVSVVPGPVVALCYARPSLDGSQGNPMLHCDRRKGHGGKHTWEWEAERVDMSNALVAARGVSEDYRQAILKHQADPDFQQLHGALVEAQRTASAAGLARLTAEADNARLRHLAHQLTNYARHKPGCNPKAAYLDDSFCGMEDMSHPREVPAVPCTCGLAALTESAVKP